VQRRLDPSSRAAERATLRISDSYSILAVSRLRMMLVNDFFFE